jgi:hypothetical protein
MNFILLGDALKLKIANFEIFWAKKRSGKTTPKYLISVFNRLVFLVN